MRDSLQSLLLHSQKENWFRYINYKTMIKNENQDIKSPENNYGH